MSDTESTAAAQEPLIDGDPLGNNDDDELVIKVVKGDSKPASKRKWRIAVALAILFFLLLVTGVGKSKISKYFLAGSKVDSEMAQMVANMNTTADPCIDPWQYTCGNYENKGATGRSVLQSAQERVYRDINEIAKAAPQSESWSWNRFVTMCNHFAVHDSVNLVENRSATWMLERGLEFAGIVVTRGRDDNTDRAERIVVVEDRELPGPCVMDFECPSSPISFTTDVLETVCVQTANPAALCERMTEFHVPKPHYVSHRWCSAEAAVLWPTSVSRAWSASKFNHRFSDQTRVLFKMLQTNIARKLDGQRQKTLATAVRNVNIRTMHTAPPEQYTIDPNAIKTFPELWAETRRQMQAANMALRFYTVEQWQMPATTINAYYDSLFNTVYVTPSIIRALWSEDFVVRLARLGFVLAHEIGHSIHSQDMKNVPIGSKSKFTAGRECLIDEYNANGTTVHEDMADRVAVSAVMASLGTSSTEQRIVCNGNCVMTTQVSRSVVHLAQTWCSSSPSSHYNGDPHSPNSQRVSHSLLHTPAVRIVWDCPVVPIEKLCTVIGS